MANGKVYIVGAGPGDPELITLKGKRAIEEADIIFYDRLINKQLLSYAKKDALLIYAGKEPNNHTIVQEELNQLLVWHAQLGNIVTRLKGGDPFIYGRGSEEAEVLDQHQIPFEIIPGITAGIAAPAYAGIPVTHRNVSNGFTVITGHDQSIEQINWDLFIKEKHTLIIYMGMKNLSKIIDKLSNHGINTETPIALVQWGTTSKQKCVTGTLETICLEAESHQISNPAIIIIGDVVRFHQPLNWFNQIGIQEQLMELSVK